MRILVDECVDQRLRFSLPGHDCQTAKFAGFAGLRNGVSIKAAESAGFDVLVTVDQNIPEQQNLDRMRLAVIILCAPTNRLLDLAPLVPRVLEALESIRSGSVIRIR